MTKLLGRKTKLTQRGVTDEMSPRYTKEMERQEAKAEIEEQLESSDFGTTSSIVAVPTDVNDCVGCYYSSTSMQKECSSAPCCLSTTENTTVIYKRIESGKLELYKIVDENDETVDDLENLTLRQAEDALPDLLNVGADVYIQGMND